MQRVQRVVDRAGAGEGAEIIAFGLAGSAMLDQLRALMLAPDQDVGKALVVAQQDVEARFQALDQVRFQQQRFGLGAREDELHGSRQRDHQGDAIGVAAGLGIARHPVLELFRLAHIKDFAVRAIHAVDARSLGQVLHIVGDDLRTGAILLRRRVGASVRSLV